MSPRITVIAHRDKLSASDGGALRDALADAGFAKVAWTEIPKGRMATKAAQKAIEKGAERVLVAGGDGTVRAAIQGIAGTEVPLAVYPTGTANLFAGALDLPTGAEGVARAAWEAEVRRIDTGLCNDLAFAVMGGTGFDASMVDGAEDDKERLGTLAYVKSGLRAARDRDRFPAVVHVDGEPFFDGEAGCVLVGNLGRLKAGAEAFPDAEPDDGLLDVAVVTAGSLREWGSVMMSALLHRQERSGLAHLTQGRKVKVELARKAPLQLDGGGKGTAKTLKFRVQPCSLSVCVTPS